MTPTAKHRGALADNAMGQLAFDPLARFTRVATNQHAAGGGGSVAGERGDESGAKAADRARIERRGSRLPSDTVCSKKLHGFVILNLASLGSTDTTLKPDRARTCTSTL